MNKIMRCITTDGSIMAAAIDSSDIVHIAQRSNSCIRTFVDCIFYYGHYAQTEKCHSHIKSKWWRPIGNFGSDFRQQRELPR